MCVYLLCLNHFVKCKKYQLPSLAEAIADMAASNAKFFTILDARKHTTSASLMKRANY